MSSIVEVKSFGQLQQTGKQLGDFAKEYLRIANCLVNTAKETSGSAWDGDDNQVYISKIEGISKALVLVSQKMETASQTIQQENSNYESRVQTNTVDASRLGS